MIERSDFGDYEKYTIASEALAVTVTTLGATATSVRFQGREMILGYDSPAGYLAGGSYIGAIVGRYANRIGGASFTLGGRRYRLQANEKENQLHGGPLAFSARRWEAMPFGRDAVRFTLFSPDGDNGYPGNLLAAVTYSVLGGTMRIDFEGVADAETVYGPTSHIYFTLGGTESILPTILRIPARHYVVTDADLIPTGELGDCAGAFDFNAPRAIGRDYDDCFILSAGVDVSASATPAPASAASTSAMAAASTDAFAAAGATPAVPEEPQTSDAVAIPVAPHTSVARLACVAEAGGVRLTLTTDYPALQLYTGTGLRAPHHINQGFAVEPEFPPDSPNRPDFADSVMKPWQPFHRFAAYTFENTFARTEGRVGDDRQV